MHRSGWLRAAVLGANDGIVSTASLLLGVASAHAPRSIIRKREFLHTELRIGCDEGKQARIAVIV